MADATKEEIAEWWKKRLLNQRTSAHPIVGRSISVDVDGPVVTLSGEVKSRDEAEELEREARGVPSVESVVSKLTVAQPDEPEHMQTVIGVFKNEEAAQLAARTVVDATKRGEDPPDVLTESAAGDGLVASMERAHVPKGRMKRFEKAIANGKALLVDRVPEDEMFGVVSALEGTPAESITTLPPEPDCFEEG
jgi:hypothetical protein